MSNFWEKDEPVQPKQPQAAKVNFWEKDEAVAVPAAPVQQVVEPIPVAPAPVAPAPVKPVATEPAYANPVANAFMPPAGSSSQAYPAPAAPVQVKEKTRWIPNDGNFHKVIKSGEPIGIVYQGKKMMAVYDATTGKFKTEIDDKSKVLGKKAVMKSDPWGPLSGANNIHTEGLMPPAQDIEMVDTYGKVELDPSQIEAFAEGRGALRSIRNTALRAFPSTATGFAAFNAAGIPAAAYAGRIHPYLAPVGMVVGGGLAAMGAGAATDMATTAMFPLDEEDELNQLLYPTENTLTQHGVGLAAMRPSVGVLKGLASAEVEALKFAGKGAALNTALAGQHRLVDEIMKDEPITWGNVFSPREMLKDAAIGGLTMHKVTGLGHVFEAPGKYVGNKLIAPLGQGPYAAAPKPGEGTQSTEELRSADQSLPRITSEEARTKYPNGYDGEVVWPDGTVTGWSGTVEATVNIVKDNPNTPATPKSTAQPAPAANDGNVPARPDRNGRDTSARDAWDEQYGDMRKGGRTHNNDGTKYVPSDAENEQKSYWSKKRSIQDFRDTLGVEDQTSAGTSVRWLSENGWKYDLATDTWSNPKEPGKTAKQALTEAFENKTQKNTATQESTSATTQEGKVPPKPGSSQQTAPAANVEPAPRFPGQEATDEAKAEWLFKSQDWTKKYGQTHNLDGTPRTPRTAPTNPTTPKQETQPADVDPAPKFPGHDAPTEQKSAWVKLYDEWMAKYKKTHWNSGKPKPIDYIEGTPEYAARVAKEAAEKEKKNATPVNVPPRPRFNKETDGASLEAIDAFKEKEKAWDDQYKSTHWEDGRPKQTAKPAAPASEAQGGKPAEPAKAPEEPVIPEAQESSPEVQLAHLREQRDRLAATQPEPGTTQEAQLKKLDEAVRKLEEQVAAKGGESSEVGLVRNEGFTPEEVAEFKAQGLRSMKKRLAEMEAAGRGDSNDAKDLRKAIEIGERGGNPPKEPTEQIDEVVEPKEDPKDVAEREALWAQENPADTTEPSKETVDYEAQKSLVAGLEKQLAKLDKQKPNKYTDKQREKIKATLEKERAALEAMPVPVAGTEQKKERTPRKVVYDDTSLRRITGRWFSINVKNGGSKNLSLNQIKESMPHLYEKAVEMDREAEAKSAAEFKRTDAEIRRFAAEARKIADSDMTVEQKQDALGELDDRVTKANFGDASASNAVFVGIDDALLTKVENSPRPIDIREAAERDFPVDDPANGWQEGTGEYSKLRLNIDEGPQGMSTIMGIAIHMSEAKDAFKEGMAADALEMAKQGKGLAETLEGYARRRAKKLIDSFEQETGIKIGKSIEAEEKHHKTGEPIKGVPFPDSGPETEGLVNNPKPKEKPVKPKKGSREDLQRKIDELQEEADEIEENDPDAAEELRAKASDLQDKLDAMGAAEPQERGRGQDGPTSDLRPNGKPYHIIGEGDVSKRRYLEHLVEIREWSKNFDIKENHNRRQKEMESLAKELGVDLKEEFKRVDAIAKAKKQLASIKDKDSDQAKKLKKTITDLGGKVPGFAETGADGEFTIEHKKGRELESKPHKGPQSFLGKNDAVEIKDSNGNVIGESILLGNEERSTFWGVEFRGREGSRRSGSYDPKAVTKEQAANINRDVLKQVLEREVAKAKASGKHNGTLEIRMDTDLAEVLGLPREASAADIARAFKKQFGYDMVDSYFPLSIGIEGTSGSTRAGAFVVDLGVKDVTRLHGDFSENRIDPSDDKKYVKQNTPFAELYSGKEPKAPQLRDGEQVEPKEPAAPDQEPAEKKYPIDKLEDALAEKGLKILRRNNTDDFVAEGGVEDNGRQRPTLVVGDTKITLASEGMEEVKGKVVIMDAQEKDAAGNVIYNIERIVTAPEGRGKGSASKALAELTEAADKAGLTLQLEPTPFRAIIGKGESLNKQQLIDWYKKNGFEQKTEGSDAILIRKPGAKEVMPKGSKEKELFDIRAKVIKSLKDELSATTDPAEEKRLKGKIDLYEYKQMQAERIIEVEGRIAKLEAEGKGNGPTAKKLRDNLEVKKAAWGESEIDAEDLGRISGKEKEPAVGDQEEMPAAEWANQRMDKLFKEWRERHPDSPELDFWKEARERHNSQSGSGWFNDIAWRKGVETNHWPKHEALRDLINQKLGENTKDLGLQKTWTHTDGTRIITDGNRFFAYDKDGNSIGPREGETSFKDVVSRVIDHGNDIQFREGSGYRARQKQMEYDRKIDKVRDEITEARRDGNEVLTQTKLEELESLLSESSRWYAGALEQKEARDEARKNRESSYKDEKNWTLDETSKQESKGQEETPKQEDKSEPKEFVPNEKQKGMMDEAEKLLNPLKDDFVARSEDLDLIDSESNRDRAWDKLRKEAAKIENTVKAKAQAMVDAGIPVEVVKKFMEKFESSYVELTFDLDGLKPSEKAPTAAGSAESIHATFKDRLDAIDAKMNERGYFAEYDWKPEFKKAANEYKQIIREMLDAGMSKEDILRIEGATNRGQNRYEGNLLDTVIKRNVFGDQEAKPAPVPDKEYPIDPATGLKPRYGIDAQAVRWLREKIKGGNLTVKDMLQYIVDSKGYMSPIVEQILKSLDSRGLNAPVLSLKGQHRDGRSSYGMKGYNVVDMVLERTRPENRERNKYDQSYEETMLEEALHALTVSKIPEGFEYGKQNMGDTLAKAKSYLAEGKDYDWRVIAEAIIEANKAFKTGKYADGTDISDSDASHIRYRLRDAAEFIVGVTQTRELQRLIKDIPSKHAPKQGFIGKLFDAIKRVWGFDTKTMNSVLDMASGAAERIAQRKLTPEELSAAEVNFKEIGKNGIGKDNRRRFFRSPPTDETRLTPEERDAIDKERDDARDIARGEKPELNVGGKVWRSVVDHPFVSWFKPLSMRMRTIADLNPQSETLQRVVNDFSLIPGKDAEAADYNTDSANMRNVFYNKLSKAFGPVLEDMRKMGPAELKEFNSLFIKQVEGRAARPVGGRVGEAIKQVRSVLEEMHQYGLDARLKLGKVEGYFPRAIDADAVDADKIGFVRAATRAYEAQFERLKQEAKDKAAEEGTEYVEPEAPDFDMMARNWRDAVLLGREGLDFEHGIFEEPRQGTKESYQKKREFTKDEALLFDHFREKDVERTIINYVGSLVRKAEVSRRIGVDNGSWGKMKSKMDKEGVDPKDIAEIEQLIKSNIGIGGKRIGQQTQEALDFTKLVSNAAYLKLTGLLNITEAASIGIRTNSAYDSARAVVQMLGRTGNVVGRLTPEQTTNAKNEIERIYGKGHDLASALAIEFGINTIDRGFGTIASGYHLDGGSDYQGKLNKASDGVYRMYGIHATEAAKREVSLRIGADFIDTTIKWLEGTHNLQRIGRAMGKKVVAENLAKDRLKEIGIKESEMAEFSDWVKKMRKGNEVQQLKDIMGNDPMAAKYRQAMIIFNKQSSVQASRGSRTESANDTPLGRLFFQFSTFTNEWSAQHGRRMSEQARKATGDSKYNASERMLAAGVAPAFAVAMAATWGIRKIMNLLTGFEYKDGEKVPGWVKSLADAFVYTGMLGPAEILWKYMSRDQVPAGVVGDLVNKSIETAKSVIENPESNTARRNAARSGYRTAAVPALNAGLALATETAPLPVKIAAGIAAQVIANNRTEKGLADIVAGPAQPRGSSEAPEPRTPPKPKPPSR
jgi:GNAT superfamily N-acetyltransferase